MSKPMRTAEKFCCSAAVHPRASLTSGTDGAPGQCGRVLHNPQPAGALPTLRSREKVNGEEEPRELRWTESWCPILHPPRSHVVKGLQRLLSVFTLHTH